MTPTSSVGSAKRHLLATTAALLTLAGACPAQASAQAGAQPQPTAAAEGQTVSPAATPAVPPEQAAAASAGAAPTATTPAANAQASGDVVVTGSRAIVNGAAAPTPVTVVTAAQLQQSAPASIADGLNQLPVFAASTRPQSSGSSATGTNGNGGNFLNLRALTPARTLVLLDGRRTVATSLAFGATDINLFPQILINRVDVVTGGASAAYGSDAVAGVVNFIVDTKFSGVKGSIQRGVSTYGDAGSYRVSLAGGTSFAGGRGHIVASVERYSSEGIEHGDDRAWVRAGYGLIPSNTGTTSIIAPDVRLTGTTYGGTINSCLPATARCPIANQSFNPDGSLTPYIAGTQVSTSASSGGSGIALRTNLTPDLRTTTAYTHAEFEFSPAATVFAEGIYSNVGTAFLGIPSNPTFAASAPTIFSGNAYLPVAVQQAMTANGITAFRLGRANRDLGDNFGITNTNTYRLVGGVRGALAGINYELSYERSQSNYHLRSTNNEIYSRLYNAVDAVRNPATGQVVCRTTLLGLPQGVGCVPVNLFGDGSVSPEARAYIDSEAEARLRTQQDDVALTLRGSPFSTWAGEVSVAAGGEYRHEQARQRVDAISASIKDATNIRGYPTSLAGTIGGFALTNPQPLSGSYSVKEGFVEVGVPLARDLSFAKSIDFNGAVRYADYSNAGGVTTWKAGLTYEPLDGVRLRVTRSRDIRAANLAELFTAASQAAGASARDTTLPSAPLTTQIVRITAGNPDLKPERANTFTAGIVVQPMRAATLSVDYYNIRIDQAISPSTLQQVIDGCAQADASLCALIQRAGAGGTISTVTTPYLNLTAIRTSGLDIEGSYRFDFLGGQVGLRALANHAFKLATTNSGITIDRAGDLGVVREGIPNWSVTGTVNYTNGGFTGFVQERFLSAGKFDSTYGPTVLPPEQNHVDAVFYTDLTLNYRVPNSPQFEVFGTVNNLFDRDPPITPNAGATIPRQANGNFFDLTGRYITIGARFRF